MRNKTASSAEGFSFISSRILLVRDYPSGLPWVWEWMYSAICNLFKRQFALTVPFSLYLSIQTHPIYFKKWKTSLLVPLLNDIGMFGLSCKVCAPSPQQRPWCSVPVPFVAASTPDMTSFDSDAFRLKLNKCVKSRCKKLLHR